MKRVELSNRVGELMEKVEEMAARVVPAQAQWCELMEKVEEVAARVVLMETQLRLSGVDKENLPLSRKVERRDEAVRSKAPCAASLLLGKEALCVDSHCPPFLPHTILTHSSRHGLLPHL